MNQAAVDILLLGKGLGASSHLMARLQGRGCRCWSAVSAEESVALFRRHQFRLMLSVNPLRTVTRTISLLGRSNCSAFHAVLVEQGCWWLPLMKNGEVCLGAPALRSEEFAGTLDAALKEIGAHSTAAPKRLQETKFDNHHPLKLAS